LHAPIISCGLNPQILGEKDSLTLAKELRKREEELNKNCKEQIKIEENGGLKLKDILGSKNPKRAVSKNKGCRTS
jgi:SMC interacting uncharacterized protein involved in chromosome segregation